jgi:hypothetical protein
MRKTLIVLTLGVALASAGAASAGGWATAGLAPPPNDIAAGETWKAELTILQHGRTPLDGVRPEVIISDGKTKIPFAAKPTGEPGKYVANVKFPSGGEWRYAVNDGFGGTHTFAPFDVAGGGGGGASGVGLIETLAGVAAALILAVVVALFIRRQRPAPRAVPTS